MTKTKTQTKAAKKLADAIDKLTMARGRSHPETRCHRCRNADTQRVREAEAELLNVVDRYADDLRELAARKVPA